MSERIERPSGLVSTKELFEYLQRLGELAPEELSEEISHMSDEQAERIRRLLPVIQDALDSRKE